MHTVRYVAVLFPLPAKACYSAVLHMFCVTTSARAPPDLETFYPSTMRNRKFEAVQSPKSVPFLKGRKGRKGHTPSIQNHVMSSGGVLP